MLSDYLRAEAGRRFELGTADCVTLVADWVRARRGVDPIAYCRGYHGERETGALIAGWGGLLRAAGRAFRRAGLSMTRDPRIGDVAIVAAGNLRLCAIRTGHGCWVMRCEKGLVMLPPDRVRVAAAWSV